MSSIRITKGGAVHAGGGWGTTACGKAFSWSQATTEATTCKSCVKVLAKREPVTAATRTPKHWTEADIMYTWDGIRGSLVTVRPEPGDTLPMLGTTKRHYVAKAGAVAMYRVTPEMIETFKLEGVETVYRPQPQTSSEDDAAYWARIDRVMVEHRAADEANYAATDAFYAAHPEAVADDSEPELMSDIPGCVDYVATDANGDDHFFTTSGDPERTVSGLESDLGVKIIGFGPVADIPTDESDLMSTIRPASVSYGRTHGVRVSPTRVRFYVKHKPSKRQRGGW